MVTTVFAMFSICPLCPDTVEPPNPAKYARPIGHPAVILITPADSGRIAQGPSRVEAAESDLGTLPAPLACPDHDDLHQYRAGAVAALDGTPHIDGNRSSYLLKRQTLAPAEGVVATMAQLHALRTQMSLSVVAVDLAATFSAKARARMERGIVTHQRDDPNTDTC